VYACEGRSDESRDLSPGGAREGANFGRPLTPLDRSRDPESPVTTPGNIEITS